MTDTMKIRLIKAYTELVNAVSSNAERIGKLSYKCGYDSRHYTEEDVLKTIQHLSDEIQSFDFKGEKQ